MESLYTRLGVSENASKEDLKKAYKGKAMEHHPDKGGDSKEFHKINYAYMVLTDDEKREKYDNGEDFEAGDTQSPEQKLRQMLFFVMSDLISNLDRDKVVYSDVLKMAKGIIDEQLKQLAIESKKKRREIGKFIEVIKRVRGSDSDWFKDTLREKIDDIKKEKDQIQEQYDIGKNMSEKLTEWEYRVDEKPYDTSSFFRNSYVFKNFQLSDN